MMNFREWAVEQERASAELKRKRSEYFTTDNNAHLLVWWDDTRYSQKDWENYSQSRIYYERQAIKIIRALVKESVSVSTDDYKNNNLCKEKGLREFLGLHYAFNGEYAALWVDDKLRIKKPYSYDFYLKGVAFDERPLNDVVIYDRIDDDGNIIGRFYDRWWYDYNIHFTTFYEWVVHKYENDCTEKGKLVNYIKNNIYYVMYAHCVDQRRYLRELSNISNETINNLFDEYGKEILCPATGFNWW